MVTFPLPPAAVEVVVMVVVVVVALVVCDEIAWLPPLPPAPVDERKSLAFWRELAELLALLPLL